MKIHAHLHTPYSWHILQEAMSHLFISTLRNIFSCVRSVLGWRLKKYSAWLTSRKPWAQNSVWSKKKNKTILDLLSKMSLNQINKAEILNICKILNNVNVTCVPRTLLLEEPVWSFSAGLPHLVEYTGLTTVGAMVLGKKYLPALLRALWVVPHSLLWVQLLPPHKGKKQESVASSKSGCLTQKWGNYEL
jgi:hypothetical protein